MNPILEAIRDRRSVRRYKPEMVPQAAIDEVIRAGLWAASGRGLQAPIVVAVTNRDLRDRLSAMNCQIGGWPPDFDPFYGAPVLLIVLAPKSVATGLYDASLVLGNMLLAAHSLGLGSCWIHRAREEFASEEGRAILRQLGVSGDYEGVGHCILGYADVAASPGAARKDGRVFYAR